MTLGADAQAQAASAVSPESYGNAMLGGVLLPLALFFGYQWLKNRKPIYVGAMLYILIENSRIRLVLDSTLPQSNGLAGQGIKPLAALLIGYIILMWFVPRILGTNRHRPSITRFCATNAVLLSVLLLLSWNNPAFWIEDLIAGWCSITGLGVALLAGWQVTQVDSDQRAATLAVCAGYGFTSLMLVLTLSGLTAEFTAAGPLWLTAALTCLLLMVGAILILEGKRGGQAAGTLAKSMASAIPSNPFDGAPEQSSPLRSEDIASRESERDLTETLTKMANSLDMHKQMNFLMSHELRVPVSTISAAAQSLEMILTGSGDIVDSRLARIRRSISRITELLDQFLNQERLSENSFAPRQESVDLSRLARDVIANIQPDAAHTLIVEAPEAIPAWCDRPLCGVVLRNLIYNAIKYSPANQPVCVRVFFIEDSDKNRVPAISVIDRGPGIEAQELERIFNPHYRRPSHREVKGMGIGLSLARRICQNQGGSLTVVSEPGHGARFTIALPATKNLA